VADGDDVIAADKQMRLAEFHARFPHLHGARGDENVFVVFLELGPLMGGDGIFQRQRMQAEFVAQTRDGVGVGGFELDPDETIRLADMVADVVECNRLAGRVAKEQAVDDESLAAKWM
jgi:hypothetical protein